MKTLVITPGGFHPFHPGHKELYLAAQRRFPGADVFMAATNDTGERPFDFQAKKILAQAAGIPENRFIQVTSPFSATEITQMYDPDDTVVVFVRSEKDREKDPYPLELQTARDPVPLATRGKRKGLPVLGPFLWDLNKKRPSPMRDHVYMDYVPVKTFGVGQGMTSATEVRSKWPGMNRDEKLDLIREFYPKAPDPNKIIKILDHYLGVPAMPAPTKPPAEKSAGKPRAVKSTSDPTLETRLSRGVSGQLEIQPRDTQQQLDEIELARDVARQLGEIVQSLKSGQYRNVEHLLYHAGGLENRIRALAQFQDWQQRNPAMDIPVGGIEIGDTDYRQEKR